MDKMLVKIWNVIEKIAYTILHAIFRVVGKELTEETFSGFMQFVKFGLVGVSNTLVNYVIYAIALLLFQKMNILSEVDYLAAQVIAFLLSVLWSFYWNNKLVFKETEGQKRNMWKTLLKTYISYSFTGLFLNSVLLVVWVQILHLSAFVAPIINIVINVPINFLINKFWAFK